MTETSNEAFPVYKAIEKPLEFMGLQGRYIYWAAVSIAIAFLGFIVVYSIFSFIFGIIYLFFALIIGAVTILIKQCRGLHSKKILKGVFIYYSTKRI